MPPDRRGNKGTEDSTRTTTKTMVDKAGSRVKVPCRMCHGNMVNHRERATNNQSVNERQNERTKEQNSILIKA
jgi:hypothetical protein